MADRIKIIHRQKPYQGANGQYNFDREYGSIMNTSIKGNRELYSLSDGTYINEAAIADYPGLLWPYKGIKLEIQGIALNNRVNYDTVDGKLYVYIFDEAKDPFIKDVGTDGGGAAIDGMLDDEHLLFGPLRWNEGCHNHDSDEVNHYFGVWGHSTPEHWDGCNCCGDVGNTGTWTDMSVTNFPVPSAGTMGSSTCSSFDPSDVFSDDIENWSSKVQKEGTDEKIWIVLKMHGNAEETGYCNKDRRNRSFQKFGISKRYFYDIIANRGITSATIKFGNRYTTKKGGYKDRDDNFVSGSYTVNDLNPTYTFPIPTTYQDSHGTESDEGAWFGDDKKTAAYECDTLVVKLHAPTDDAYSVDNAPEGVENTYVNVASAPEFVNLDPNERINYISFMNTGSIVYGHDQIPFYSDSDASFITRRNDVVDFRPISFVSVSESWDYDLQGFYDYSDEYVYTTAPNIVDLTFRIAEDSPAWFPSYIDGYNPDSGLDFIGLDDAVLKNQRFMFYVTDWNALDTEIDWVEIMQNFPSDYSSLQALQSDPETSDDDDPSTHNIVDLFYWYDENHPSWQEGDIEEWRYNFASHTYNTPGIKIIKAIVFSYIRNPVATYDAGNDWVQTLRWKAVSIKINLNVDNAYVQDFSDLGGNDYTYLPWPETSPIIGGISKTSQYVQSTKSVVKENFFSEHEIVEEGLSLQAFANTPGEYVDELGDHLGKVDIAQFRYFTEGYDMNDLLMLPETRNFYNCSIQYGECDEGILPGQFRPNDPSLVCGGDYYYHKYQGGLCEYSPVGTECEDGDSCILTGQIYVNYDEFYKFYDLENEVGGFPENPTYPEGSCVGSLFISNNTNTPLMESCINELNMNLIDGITIHDSSGNDNRGIVIGDYKVTKAGYDKPITREDPTDLPKVNVEDLAF